MSPESPPPPKKFTEPQAYCWNNREVVGKTIAAFELTCTGLAVIMLQVYKSRITLCQNQPMHCTIPGAAADLSFKLV